MTMSHDEDLLSLGKRNLSLHAPRINFAEIPPIFYYIITKAAQIATAQTKSSQSLVNTSSSDETSSFRGNLSSRSHRHGIGVTSCSCGGAAGRLVGDEQIRIQTMWYESNGLSKPV